MAGFVRQVHVVMCAVFMTTFVIFNHREIMICLSVVITADKVLKVGGNPQYGPNV